ncbi:MAG: hypothetical protein ACFFES_18585, partial [Candidatus Thorarchaeota archaeon]
LEKEKLQAEHLAAVGETVAGMAHSIKNILTGLTGGMYAIKSGIKSGREDRTAKGWEMLDRNVERITTLVKGFLSYSKKHVPKLEEIDPQDLARDVFSLYYAGALKAGVTLLFEGRRGSPLRPWSPRASTPAWPISSRTRSTPARRPRRKGVVSA